MVPLDMTEEKAELMTGVLGCKLQGMPFTYLGLPMGTTKPRVDHFTHHMGLIQMPIPSRGTTDFPIIEYVDDTILIMQASQRELLCLKAILEIFAQSTGLRVNYAKSCMVPLNMTEEKAELMTRVLGCKLQGMSFTYLGLPMGTTKPRVEHFAPLMNRVERQLTSISNILTYVGKLQLVNSILSSLPTYTMCSISVPVEVHEYVDRARRHYMWRNSEANAKDKPIVAWKKCTRPKRKGGLGIVNLRSQNAALLMKHLDNFYNYKDIPWVKLIWATYYSHGEVPHATKDHSGGGMSLSSVTCSEGLRIV
jgi:hypothetical protein